MDGIYNQMLAQMIAQSRAKALKQLPSYQRPRQNMMGGSAPAMSAGIPSIPGTDSGGMGLLGLYDMIQGNPAGTTTTRSILGSIFGGG